MATQKQSKNDSNLRDLFAKTPAKKQDPTRELHSDPGGGSGDGTVEEDANPVTKAFMEQIFGTLRENLAALRQELATTVKELKGEVTELGQRVDTVEGSRRTPCKQVPNMLTSELDKDITPVEVLEAIRRLRVGKVP
ncbi:hypothetical protein NDU88_005384 [Pleurodeles waltl]|uniref:Uncharacterized protein n=1 Tax=Pleurodeles waltl TaxID=8319 RepID=A0AAV7WBQ6_PLEWA|nr:hypothetical protein NDU88_005384 [Pleurodeles waltl]